MQMKLPVRALVLICLVAIGFHVGGWAEEAQPQPATPQEVVKRFSDLLGLAGCWDLPFQPLEELFSQRSRRALAESEGDLLSTIAPWLMFPELQPQQLHIEGSTASVRVLPKRRTLEVKLVKEDGQWRVDLIATLLGLREPFRGTYDWLFKQPYDPRETPKFMNEASPSDAVLPRLLAESFEPEVLEANKPVVVGFWEQWGAGGMLMKWIVRELAEEYAGQVKFCSLNVDEAEEIARRYGVNAIPCMIMFRDGQEVARHVGLVPKTELKFWIDQHRQ